MRPSLPAALSLSILFLLLAPSLAYIDPGTGGMVVGSVWSLATGFLALLGILAAKFLFDPLKRLVSRIWKGKQAKGEKT